LTLSAQGAVDRVATRLADAVTRDAPRQFGDGDAARKDQHEDQQTLRQARPRVQRAVVWHHEKAEADEADQSERPRR